MEWLNLGVGALEGSPSHSFPIMFSPSLLHLFPWFCLLSIPGSSNHVTFGIPSRCGHLRSTQLGGVRGKMKWIFGPLFLTCVLSQLTCPSFIIQTLTEHLPRARHCSRCGDPAMKETGRHLSHMVSKSIIIPDRAGTVSDKCHRLSKALNK